MGRDVAGETIGTRFGGVPSALPTFRMPAVDFAMLPDLRAGTQVVMPKVVVAGS